MSKKYNLRKGANVGETVVEILTEFHGKRSRYPWKGAVKGG